MFNPGFLRFAVYNKISPLLLVEAMDTRDLLLAVVIVALGVALVYFLDPTFGGLLRSQRSAFGLDTFADMPHLGAATQVVPNFNGPQQMQQNMQQNYAVDNLASVSGMSPAASGFASTDAPQNCYPKKQLRASELLPNDPNSQWVQANPMAPGSIMDKNFLNAGYQIGVDTIGQSLRNASHDLRSEPANPQQQVGPWNQSTIEPDINRKPLEIGS
jgi:hypothetical protein